MPLRIRTLVTLALLCVLPACAPSTTQTEAEESMSSSQPGNALAGTWWLVSSTVDEEGTVTEPYGPDPQGIMTVDSGDRYVIVTTRAGLPAFASGNRTTGTPDENAAVVGGSIAHFGTISVNEAEQAIDLNIEASSFPNWNGTDQSWPYTVTGDTLSFTVPLASGGGTATAVWIRAR